MACVEYICKTKGCGGIYPQNDEPEKCEECGGKDFNYLYDEES